MAVERGREVSRGLGRAALALVVLALAAWLVYAGFMIAGADRASSDALAGPAVARDSALFEPSTGGVAGAEAVTDDVVASSSGGPSPEAEPSGVPVPGASALEASLPQDVAGFGTEGFVALPAPDGVQAFQAVFVPVVKAAQGDVVRVDVTTWPTTTAAVSAGEDAVRGVVDRGGKLRKVPRGLPDGARRADAEGVSTVVWTQFTTTFVVVGPPGQAASLARGFGLG